MEILGHRGRPCAATPENTLESVRAAFADGADGVEVDVRLTADDVAVCCHDAGLNRVAGVHRGLRAITSSELATIRVQGHPVPSVGVVVDDLPPGGTLVLDLKPEQRPRRLVQALARPLSNAPAGAVVLSSFDTNILDTCARLLPEVPRARIVRPDEPLSTVLAGAQRRGDAALHLPLQAVFAAPELVQRAQARGFAVRVWTVNRTVDARLLTVLAVDGLISDVPGALRQALGPPRRLVST